MSRLFLTILISIQLFSCYASSDSLLEGFGTRSFWASRIRTSGSTTTYTPYLVPAIFSGSSAHAVIYVAIDSPVTRDVARDILQTFEDRIRTPEETYFGPSPDINSDGKVVLLLLDIDDGASPGDPYVAGYFSAYDEYTDGSVKSQTCSKDPSVCIRSNEKEVLYLDTYPAVPGSPGFLATVAHEYQHMLHFHHDEIGLKQGLATTDEETWVNEGLSEMASDITGYGPQTGRLKGYSSTDGDSLIVWDGKLNDYSMVYSYFRLLADIYGTDIITKIFRDYKTGIAGVDSALSSMSDPQWISAGACGSTTGLTYPYFTCSGRYYWSSILNITGVSGAVGNTTSGAMFTKPANYSYAAGHKPDIPGVKSISPLAESLKPYGGFFYQKAAGASVSLSTLACSGCSLVDFTVLYDPAATNAILFNHNTSNFSDAKIKITTPVIISDINLSENYSTETPMCAIIPVTSEILSNLKPAALGPQ